MCNSHKSRAVISSHSRQCPSPIPAKIPLPDQRPVSVWKDQILYLFPGLFTADSSTGQANPRKSNPWQWPGHPCTAAEIYSRGWGRSSCIKFHLNSISQQQPCRNIPTAPGRGDGARPAPTSAPEAAGAGNSSSAQAKAGCTFRAWPSLSQPDNPACGARSQGGFTLVPSQGLILAPREDLILVPSQDLILAPREDLAPGEEFGGAEPLSCLSLRDPEPQRGQSHLTQ